MKTLFMIELGLFAFVVLLCVLWGICYCIYQIITSVIDMINLHRYDPEEEHNRKQDIMDW